jgi:hypothetical protein
MCNDDVFVSLYFGGNKQRRWDHGLQWTNCRLGSKTIPMTTSEKKAPMLVRG